MEWSESHQAYIPVDWKSAFHVTEAEMKAVYDRCVIAFDKACEEIERQDDAFKIDHLLRSTLGVTTYEIPED